VREMARQTVEIDNDLWQKFLKKMVDVYGSAYGSRKKDALNEAIQLWLEAKEAGSRKPTESMKAEKLIEKGKISPVVLSILAEEETMIPVGRERKIISEALRTRLS